MRRLNTIYLSIIVAMAVILVNCRKENLITDSSAKLEFSLDTVLFDTVFTSIGSTTQLLKVYNRHNKDIQVSRIRIEQGSTSQYRINVDGINGASHTDIIIPENDSIFIFVEVTIDPGGLNLPFIVEDNIVFETNGNEQKVNLVAWGQDAYFHGGLGNLTVLDPNEEWNNDKPHVVYGIVAVDSAECLTINPGTQVYCHAGSGIYVYKGCIHVLGELNNEVVFQGDRLEPFYDELAGQWGIEIDFDYETQFGIETATISRGGLWLYECLPSTINYAVLKNGIVGIQMDTVGNTGGGFGLDITNTIVRNMSAVGLWAQGGDIHCENSLVANCGANCTALTIGGRYHFDHCTVANYWNESNRQDATFALTNYYESIDGDLIVRPVEAIFRNCILYGNNADLTDFSEFIIDLEQEESQNYVFDHCFIDTQENVSDDGLHWFSVANNPSEPPFIDPFNADFDLPVSVNSTLTAPQIGGVGEDIEGWTRNSPTALGCYEANNE
ncbi:MAG: hypothetical protein KDC12_02625 [Flavobacteriales bacterium]|nr:hypothetical protein [Flavobacteriales bacterium]